jgi:hypothetical protein
MNNRQYEKAKKNLRDNKVPGLMLSVGKRSKTFYLYRRVDGKPRRILLGRFSGCRLDLAIGRKNGPSPANSAAG